MDKYSQNLDILDIKIYNFSLKDNTAKKFFLPNKLLINKWDGRVDTYIISHVFYKELKFK